jgi:hypothetical protein
VWQGPSTNCPFKVFFLYPSVPHTVIFHLLSFWTSFEFDHYIISLDFFYFHLHFILYSYLPLLILILLCLLTLFWLNFHFLLYFFNK